MYKKILLPTDGSELSLKAADQAVALAKLSGAALHAVTVLEPYPYTGIGAANQAGLQEYLAAGQRHAADAFHRIEDAAKAQGVAFSTEVVEGKSPAEEIAAAAARNGADLVVMASHGRTGAARVLLGSVAAKVVAMATVPVMVVR